MCGPNIPEPSRSVARLLKDSDLQLRSCLVNATWSIVLTVLSLLATAISAIAAIGSWRAARRADQAATTLANIERDRRHTELTPDFNVTCYRRAVGDRAELRLTFTGPPGLDRLDGAEVTIRDDRSNRTPTTAADPSAEELAAAIWGPLRFCPHVNDADKLGRSVPAVPLAKQEIIRLALEPSLAPRWVNDHAHWRQQYADDPLRLTITCTREGHAPWVIPIDVRIEPGPTGQQRAIEQGD